MEKINKEIYRLTWPNIASNISVPILGLVDTAIMGHLNDSIYLGAVSIGTMIFNLIYLSLSFLRMGTLGVTAQAYGRKDKNEMKYILVQGLIISCTLGVLLILSQQIINNISFYFINGDNKLESLASQYFYIRIWAAPATISLYVFNGWFVGTQNPKIPMYSAITANITNIVLNILFVVIYEMKSDGVALSTVISQYIGVIISIFFIKKQYKPLNKIKIKFKNIKLDRLKNYLKININIFIRTISLLSVFTFFTSKSASYGKIILASNSILMQFFYFFSYFIDGFANAAEAMIGKYKGMNNKIIMNITIKKLNYIGIKLSTITALIYFLLFENIINLLSSQENIIRVALKYKFWIVLIPITSFLAFIWDGIFVGLTETSAMRNNMIMAAFIFFFPVYYISQKYISYHSLWLSINTFLLARGVTLIIHYKLKLCRHVDNKK